MKLVGSVLLEDGRMMLRIRTTLAKGTMTSARRSRTLETAASSAGVVEREQRQPHKQQPENSSGIWELGDLKAIQNHSVAGAADQRG
jgi:hypothetical protein